MLAALGSTATGGRRVAVLGQMLELGSLSGALHEACGRAAAGAADLLVAIGGPDGDAYAAGASAAGMSRARIHRFANSGVAAEAIGSIVQPGDLVLVKGSRGTRTDLVVDRLVAGA
jgi:UDP-N-acetylmuramoyl-tripeptide--D-alanyl-D-alanine ligase